MSSDSDDSAVLVEKRDVAGSAVAEKEPPYLVDENEMKDNKETAKDQQQQQESRACQIVSIIVNKEDIDAEKKEAADDKKKKKDGNDDSNDNDDDDRCCYAFHFEKENLQQIVNRIPSHYKVSVVSVVGAFRTGKSFLLSWFLRYLHYCQQQRESTKTSQNKSDNDTGKDEEPWYKSFTSIGNDGFDWRAGKNIV